MEDGVSRYTLIFYYFYVMKLFQLFRLASKQLKSSADLLGGFIAVFFAINIEQLSFLLSLLISLK